MKRSVLPVILAAVALCGLSLSGCTQQSLPYPKPTSAKQTNADFMSAAKSGDYALLEKITNPPANGQARTSTIRIAKKLNRALHKSGCSLSKQKVHGSKGSWFATNRVKCADHLTDYTVGIAQYSWKINAALASDLSLDTPWP